jgi:hypothetical protein
MSESWEQAVSEEEALRGALERHLRRTRPGLRVVALRSLASDGSVSDASAKARGYGLPLEVVARVGGAEVRYVLHRYRNDEYGHARTSDRVAEALAAAEAYARVPGHVRPLDVGVFDGRGELVSLRATEEPFLLTEWADGSLYAEELRGLAERGEASSVDRERVAALVRYLVALHVPVVAHPGA